jgi:hypothetical protein
MIQDNVIRFDLSLTTIFFTQSVKSNFSASPQPPQKGSTYTGFGSSLYLRMPDTFSNKAVLPPGYLRGEGVVGNCHSFVPQYCF